VIKSLKFNIYLDGTISAERLGLLLDIAPEEILAIRTMASRSQQSQDGSNHWDGQIGQRAV
jgi:hypothetical protein